MPSLRTLLSELFPEHDIHEIAHDFDEESKVVCITIDDVASCSTVLAALQEYPESFVRFNGYRYFPDGRMTLIDPTCLQYAGELHLCFDTEWVTLGPHPRVHVFVHTEHQWEQAKQAFRHLLQLGRLSTQSYLESDHTGQDQGLCAQNLDATPHGASLVALFRESAYREQNEIDNPYDDDDEQEWQEDKGRDEEEEDDDDEWKERMWGREDEAWPGDTEVAEQEADVAEVDDWSEEETPPRVTELVRRRIWALIRRRFF